MRILKSKALVMNAFPPNWVREVIIWALTLNRAGLLLSRIVVHLPKNCPAVSAGRKPRLRLLILLGVGALGEPGSLSCKDS